jgi:YidC/Oxa1 family membrane protein insertase
MLETASILQPIIDGSDAVVRFWHGVTGSWGLAIILLTFTIRLLILPLTFSSVKSMQKLQVLQPEMKKLQERFKDDKQRLNQEMMAFYKENKVNPLGSCLPLALQFPFFISLFQLLRSADFKAEIGAPEPFLFLPDLATKLTSHPFVLGVMIVLYVGTQLIASLITSVGGDKTQQRIMFALPFIFVIPVATFPAGLILYWVTTNVWTIGQQLVVRKLYPRPDLAKDDDKPGDGAKPARGKPATAAAAVSAGDGAKEAKPAKDKSGDGNGAAAKAPPGSPRKKKKRSGRRR